MPDQEASKALRDAVEKHDGLARVGLIHSIGERRNPHDAGFLIRMLRLDDPAAVRATVQALGQVGGRRAVAGLTLARLGASDDLLPVIDDALLSCAGVMVQSEDESGTTALLLEGLAGPGTSPVARAGAITLLAEYKGDEAGPFVLDSLKDDMPVVREAAASVLRETAQVSTLAFVKEALPDLPPDVSIMAVSALTSRCDTQSLELEAVISELAWSHADSSVRIACLESLARVGDKKAMLVLACAAASTSDAEATVARQALAMLSSSSCDTQMAQLLQSPNLASRLEQEAIRLTSGKPDAAEWARKPSATAIRIAIAHALATRFVQGPQLTTLMQVATNDSDATVRAACIESIGDLAPEQAITTVAQRIAGDQDASVRAAAETALVAIARKHEASQKAAQALLAELNATAITDTGAASVLQALGEIGHDDAIPALSAAWKSGTAPIQEAAIRALAKWPTVSAISELEAIAQQASSESLRILALRDYFRLVPLVSEASAQETAQRYEQGINIAQRNDEKVLGIRGLGETPDSLSVEILKRLTAIPELTQEASAALDNLAKRQMTVSASHQSEEAGKAIDGDLSTRWTTGVPQQDGQWFMLDLGWAKTVSSLVLDAGSSVGDYPRSYAVYVSDNDSSWGEPVAKGVGSNARFEMSFTPAKGRFVRIVQTGSDGLWWSIHELSIQAE